MATVKEILLWVFLPIFLLSSTLINAQAILNEVNGGSEEFGGLNHSEVHSDLEDNALKNFNRALQFVTNNEEFQPLYLSIGSFGLRNSILDNVGEFLRKNIAGYYRFDLEVIGKREAKLPSKVTWIIVVDEPNTLNAYVREHVHFWRAAKQFLILFSGNETNHDNSNQWLDVFKILWNRHQVCKVLIASIHENFKYLYRYMPFAKEAEKYGVVQRLNVQNMSSYSPVVQNKGFSSIESQEFYRQVDTKNGRASVFEDFRNFNGYPIHVTVFTSLMMEIKTNKVNETTYGRLDANVMNLVEERLHSKFMMNVIDAEEDGDPFMKALDAIKTGESDIVFTAYFAKLYLTHHSYFVLTTSIFEDKVCLIAPSSEPVPKYFMPLLPFDNKLWVLLLWYNLVMAALWLLIKRIQFTYRGRSQVVTTDLGVIDIRVISYRISKHSEINRCLKRPRPLRVRFRYSRSYSEPRRIHPWIIRLFDLLTLTCYPLTGGKTHTERAFLFGTLFFGLIVVGLYQSNLVSSLSKPIFYPELNTLADVIESNRTLITKYKNMADNTFTPGTPDSDKLTKKLEISTSLEKTYEMVAFRGVVSIGRFASFQLENLTQYYNKATNKLLLHVVEECPAKYPLSYPARLHSPYLERIDGLLLRMQQAGLIHKWYGDMLSRAKVKTAKSLPSRQSDDRVKLTLQHLSLTFLGLGIGLFSSTIVFLGELHYARKLGCSTSRDFLSTLSNKEINCILIYKEGVPTARESEENGNRAFAPPLEYVATVIWLVCTYILRMYTL